uniref:Uncharacterized protein n=1 Tax=Arundo donax TaxID=35708 RepID=A0A0A9GB75_ARUDO
MDPTKVSTSKLQFQLYVKLLYLSISLDS